VKYLLKVSPKLLLEEILKAQRLNNWIFHCSKQICYGVIDIKSAILV